MDFLKIFSGILFSVTIVNSCSMSAKDEMHPWINYYHKFDFIQDIRSGKYFEPSGFWGKNIKEQMLFLKNEIKACDLIHVISDHYDPTWKYYFVRPSGKPYPKAIEEQFEELVYEKIKSFDPTLSKGDFKDSLVKRDPLNDLIYQKFKASDPDLSETYFSETILPQFPYYKRFSETPLLFHFDDYLCPQYKIVTELSFYGEEFKMLPSKFEEWLMGKKES